MSVNNNTNTTWYVTLLHVFIKVIPIVVLVTVHIVITIFEQLKIASALENLELHPPLEHARVVHDFRTISAK